jgi:hypothetical protein
MVPRLTKGLWLAAVALAAGVLLVAPYAKAEAPEATAPNYSVLHSFTSGADGYFPVAGLTLGKHGVLYGTTQYGGTSATCSGGEAGTIFQLTPPSSPGSQWAESVLYTFSSAAGSTPGDCLAEPTASVTTGPKGELYGTTLFGGPQGVGTVYELLPPVTPGGSWTMTTLYAFESATGDPQNPQGGLVIGAGGVLYGTTQFAGSSPVCPFYSLDYGCGAVYSLTPPASPGGSWTYETLYTFQGGSDGAAPQTTLTLGPHGVLFGATPAGGPGALCGNNPFAGAGFSPQSPGCGTIFELDPPATAHGSWTEKVLYGFQGKSDGGFPTGVVYHDGVLDGTVTVGGDPTNCGGVGCGGVFRLTPPAAPGGSWTERLLYSFSGASDGLYPYAGLAVGQDGSLYGTTRDGGNTGACAQSPGCGVVFELIPPRDSPGPSPEQIRPAQEIHPWQEKILHRFAASDGWLPIAPLIIDQDGELVGTTYLGGDSAQCVGGCGVVFATSTQDSTTGQGQGRLR